MRKMRVLELLPFLALIAVAAILSSTVLAAAGFSFPDLFGQFSFGKPAAYNPGTTTTVVKAGMPFGDMSLPSGFSLPISNFSPFHMPVTSQRSYTQTIMTPDGPRTQAVDQAFDGSTGERTTTVTNL